jgi:hypothetical protein
MTRRRSRRRQEQINRELFGPGQRSPRPPKRRSPRALVVHVGTPGSCWACGNICSPVVDWTCMHCGVTYPPVSDRSEAWVARPDGQGGHTLTMEVV